MRLSTTSDQELEKDNPEWMREMIDDPDDAIVKLYRTDSWVRNFMVNCFDIYGGPKYFRSCASVDDEYYYTFASMLLVIAMKEMREDWETLKSEEIEPIEAAYQFAEIYFTRKGEHLLPPFGHGAATDLNDEYEY